MNSEWSPAFLNTFFELFLNLKAELLPWVAAIIMIRVLINLVMFKSVSDMATIIKDVFFGMILLCFFVEIVKFSQMIPNLLHEKLSSPEQVEITLSDGQHPFWTIASYVTVGAYWIAKLIYMLFIAILIATGAFVIIAGTMLAQRYLLNIFFIGLFGASLMPLVWFAINEAMKSFARANEQSLANLFVLIGGELLKLGVPLAGAAAVLKNPFVENTKSAAKLPMKGTSSLMATAGKHLRPESRAVQFYQTMRGGAGGGMGNFQRNIASSARGEMARKRIFSLEADKGLAHLDPRENHSGTPSRDKNQSRKSKPTERRAKGTGSENRSSSPKAQLASRHQITQREDHVQLNTREMRSSLMNAGSNNPKSLNGIHTQKIDGVVAYDSKSKTDPMARRSLNKAAPQARSVANSSNWITPKANPPSNHKRHLDFNADRVHEKPLIDSGFENPVVLKNSSLEKTIGG